jgi:hypothetical protein
MNPVTWLATPSAPNARGVEWDQIAVGAASVLALLREASELISARRRGGQQSRRDRTVERAEPVQITIEQVEVLVADPEHGVQIAGEIAGIQRDGQQVEVTIAAGPEASR